MKPNKFNICPSCKHFETCVLTKHKSQVWSCSEYDQVLTQPFISSKIEMNNIAKL